MRFAQASATVPEPCHVLGTSLRPFCLGHHLLFKRLKLPFCGNPLASACDEDVLIGIAICAQRYEDNLEQLISGEWSKNIIRWKTKIAKQLSHQRQLNEGFLLFRAYLQDGYEHVPIWKYTSAKGVALSAPWEVLLKNSLVMNGYSKTEVLNGYLPELWYDYYTVMELRSATQCQDSAKWRKIFYTEDDYRKHNPGGNK
jgi:hypothetical protein